MFVVPELLPEESRREKDGPDESRDFFLEIVGSSAVVECNESGGRVNSDECRNYYRDPAYPLIFEAADGESIYL